MVYQIHTSYTLSDVVKKVAGMVGHPVPVDITASQDPAIAQMILAANEANTELMTAYDWTKLQKMGSIVVASDFVGQVEKGFDFPEDYNRFVDQTQWNAAMQFPAMGPVSPQGWMAYLVYPITSAFTLTWQVREDRIWFLTPPAPPGQQFRFIYISCASVIDAENPSVLKNEAVKNGDTFKLDGVLVQYLARAKYLGWKGFDTTVADSEYETKYNSRTGVEKGAPVLSIVGGVSSGAGLIGPGNVPVTGFGGAH